MIHLICGARPNFVKVAPLYRELAQYEELDVKILHTGQHYNKSLSASFFHDLNIPEPDFSFKIGSGTHAEQTANCMLAYEKVCLEIPPALTVVVGDVNSTLACCLVAKKLNIAVAHVEAGLRSFDRSMPEEINRIVVDSISDFHFTPSEDANINLRNEGVPASSIHLVGNIMIDSLVSSLSKISLEDLFLKLNLRPKSYALLTLHRPSNVDIENKVKEILSVVGSCADTQFVFPVHPRSMKIINSMKLGKAYENLKLIDPLSYLDFLGLMKESQFALTDSGGVQEETSYLNIPCLTIRDNTERPITVTHGTNTLITVGELADRLSSKDFMQKKSKHIPLWDGSTASRISNIIIKQLGVM